MESRTWLGGRVRKLETKPHCAGHRSRYDWNRNLKMSGLVWNKVKLTFRAAKWVVLVQAERVCSTLIAFQSGNVFLKFSELDCFKFLENGYLQSNNIVWLALKFYLAFTLSLRRTQTGITTALRLVLQQIIKCWLQCLRNLLFRLHYMRKVHSSGNWKSQHCKDRIFWKTKIDNLL